MADLKSKQYENSELPRTLLDSLNVMRNRREHCDVFLRVESEVFPAHRAVLAASSSYFRAMFSTSSYFAEANNAEVRLRSVDKVAVREVLDYFYTGKLKLTHLNLENVLILASFWDVPFLVSSSEDFLRQELRVSNCLAVQHLVNNHQTFSSSFPAFVNKFILDNFMDISKQQEFLFLSVDRLVDLLRNDLLRVKSEEMVFEAVLNWIKYNRCSRKHFLVELFQEVRFGLMAPSYLTDRVLRDDLVQQDSECKELVTQALQQATTTPDLDLPLKKRKVDALYLFGGYLNNTRSIKGKAFLPQFLDCAMGKTNLEEFPPIHMTGCHVASFRHFIYFNIVNTNMVTRFNKLTLEASKVFIFDTDTSNTVNSMSCACQQFMYVVGGTCYRRFDTVTDQWQRLPIPRYQHFRPGVCSLNDKVYVIGGCDNCYQECVNYVERFDVTSKSWETLAPMSTGRWGAGVAVKNDKIYVVGGE